MSTESPPAGAQKTDGAPEHAESASALLLAAGAETMGANEEYSSSSAQEWLLVDAQTKRRVEEAWHQWSSTTGASGSDGSSGHAFALRELLSSLQGLSVNDAHLNGYRDGYRQGFSDGRMATEESRPQASKTTADTGNNDTKDAAKTKRRKTYVNREYAEADLTQDFVVEVQTGKKTWTIYPEFVQERFRNCDPGATFTYPFCEDDAWTYEIKKLEEPEEDRHGGYSILGFQQRCDGVYSKRAIRQHIRTEPKTEF